MPTRREILKSAAALTAAAALPSLVSAQVEALGQEFVDAPTTRGSTGPEVRVLLREADGSPLDMERARTLTARDGIGDPLPQHIAVAEGRARVALAGEPIQLTCRLRIPDFGEVYCYADGGSFGYANPGTIDFAVEAARTRHRRVRQELENALDDGTPLPDAFFRHLEAAFQIVRTLPAAGTVGTAHVAAAYAALSHAMHAGEMLALGQARHRIARLAAPRKEFLFGCMVSRFDSDPRYNKAIEDAYNFATVSWYSWKEENPPERRIDYARMDNSINWCLARGITPKTFGYTYMARGATPDWVRPSEEAVKAAKGSVFNERWKYEDLLKLYTHTNEQTARRYAGKPVPFIEVINEAHDKANLWRLSQQQVLEMAKESCAAVRRGNATIQRQMNHCCLWAEYAKNRNLDGSRRWSPYTYIKDCLAAGVEFELLGLQLYYPQYDLFETSRTLDRFAEFGKPCHITECATQSIDGKDPTSMRPNTPTPGWHGSWSETMQADWLEGVYTLVYSKPHFTAMEWWDVADTGGHFWPHGGVLRPDLTPKESYHRLLALQKKWGVGKEMTKPQ